MTCQYAELHTVSNFTFLRGASHPEELVARASALGYRAIALTDECSLSGVVRAHVEAKQHDIKLITGAEITLREGIHLVLLSTDRTSYGLLSHLISHGRRNAPKGSYRLQRQDLEHLTPRGCEVIWKADSESTTEQGTWLAGLFPGSAWIGVTLQRDGGDALRLACSERLASQCRYHRGV